MNDIVWVVVLQGYAGASIQGVYASQDAAQRAWWAGGGDSEWLAIEPWRVQT